MYIIILYEYNDTEYDKKYKLVKYEVYLIVSQ